MSDKRRRIPTTAGWRATPDTHDQLVLVLDRTHPDYPRALHEKGLAEDFAAFDRDEQIQAAAERIRRRVESLPRRFHEAVYQSGDLNRSINALSSELVAIITEEEARAGPTTQHPRRWAYLANIAYAAYDTLPAPLGGQVAEQLRETTIAKYGAPFRVIVNPNEGATFPQVYPHETAIILGRFPSSDLPKLGRIVTEAQVLAGQVDERGYGGRPKLPDHSHEAATPETVAKLRHWGEWSHRRIAAFFGWLEPDEDWTDEKVRRRVEQKVRRWVREGEAILRAQTPADQDWRQKPPHLEQAEHAERERRPRV